MNAQMRRPMGRECAYNLFRNRKRREILCAVPEDRPVPGFLKAQAWYFGGKLDRKKAVLRGFDEQAAEISVHFNGFYLFQIIAPTSHPPKAVSTRRTARGPTRV